MKPVSKIGWLEKGLMISRSLRRSAMSVLAAAFLGAGADAQTYQANLGPGVQGFPITYNVDGEQFVAVTTGLQGGSPVQKPATMLQEVHRSQTGQAVYVFALPKQR